MPDIFDEISSELRRDRAREVWNRYGIFVIGLALAIILSVAGVSIYQAYIKNSNEAASLRFETMQSKIANAEAARAIEALARFAEAENNGYGLLADFHRARHLLDLGRKAEAVELFEKLAKQALLPPTLRDYARISAAYALLGTISAAQLEEQLVDMLRGDNALRHSAREIVALGYYLEADYLAAHEIYRIALADPELPQMLATRLNIVNKQLKAQLIDNKPRPDNAAQNNEPK